MTTYSQAELFLSCSGRNEQIIFLFFCVRVCVLLHKPIAIYSRKGKGGGELSSSHFVYSQRFWYICCLVCGRLNKFKVEQTAAFSHIAAWGGKRKKTLLGNCARPVQNSNECGRNPVVRVEKTGNPGRQTVNPNKMQKSQRRQGGWRCISDS